MVPQAAPVIATVPGSREAPYGETSKGGRIVMTHSVRNRLDRMVADLRADNCLVSERVANAFATVPRHLFLPGIPLRRAYGHDQAIATQVDRQGVATSSASAPNIMALMLEQLDAQPGQHVLEIGAGTGYNAALLAHLVGDTGTVVSLDLDAEVARGAVEHLRAAGISGVTVMARDGWLGHPGADRLDRIMATVECGDISPHWERQLNPGGTLVLPLWLRPGLEATVKFVKSAAGLVSQSMAYCRFIPFRGPHAGPSRHILVPGWSDGEPGGAAGSEWLAALDDVTPARVAMLRTLLSGPVRRSPAPKLFAGWNLRLALEEPDPIYLVHTRTRWRSATGLFDASSGGVALLDGASLVAFGDHSCLERLVASLERARPLDLASLQITAVPHTAGSDRGVDVVLRRTNYDLVVRGLDTPPGPVAIR